VRVSNFLLTLMTLVAIAFVIGSRDAKHSNADQQCETENVTDTHVRECSIRRTLQDEADRVDPAGKAAGR
jgi:hypothetical protein